MIFSFTCVSYVLAVNLAAVVYVLVERLPARSADERPITTWLWLPDNTIAAIHDDCSATISVAWILRRLMSWRRRNERGFNAFAIRALRICERAPAVRSYGF